LEFIGAGFSYVTVKMAMNICKFLAVTVHSTDAISCAYMTWVYVVGNPCEIKQRKKLKLPVLKHHTMKTYGGR
jgi:hypothetical protein